KKAGAVQPLMRALVVVKEEVEEHAVEPANSTIDEFGDEDRLRLPLGEWKFQRTNLQGFELSLGRKAEEVPAFFRPEVPPLRRPPEALQ
ncbi:MAG TPA: hypothetical protein VEI04_12870, partial [Syntrophobacteria bacterium]|nr:hypothetical protein [Syntrophobacteria bacterium]